MLSNESVNSNNVMDEVSFALEKTKSVIPILLNDFNTPFRLKRLQHIDFKDAYKDGLSELLEVLNQHLVIETAVEKDTGPIYNEKSSVAKNNTSAFKSLKTRKWFIIGGLAILIFIVFIFQYLN